MIKRPGFVYKIQNILNGKVYIGASINPKKRYIAHKSTARSLVNARHIHHAMNKHIENIDAIFKLQILCEFESETEAYEHEVKAIAWCKENNIEIYNETAGGEYGPVLYGEENGFYRKSHTEKTKLKISKANTGKFAGEKNYFFGKRFCGADHPLYGTKRSQNVLDALSKAHKGKIISDETKIKMSEAHKGKMTGDKNPMFGIKGDLHPNSGITDAVAKEIYLMYHRDKKSPKYIMVQYKVNKSTFQRVVSSTGRFVWTKDIQT